MRPTIKQFEKKLDKLITLVKERVRIGEIIYSTRKDAEAFDKKNWMAECEEELADAIAYMTFAYIQFETVYRLLRQAENRLIERTRELNKIE